MKVTVLKECGYEEAALGFSLSYNTEPKRSMEIMPKYAFGIPGENKFLEQIIVYLDVTAPRYWWQEADTYRVGTSKQSESTMHTLCKKGVSKENFEGFVSQNILDELDLSIKAYRDKMVSIAYVKNILPEGFLQRRIWMVSYKTLQNIYIQRINHRLPQWQYFLETILNNIEHPEFVVKGYK